MKYSVIIPVYNAEKTLKRCLDSILKQGCEDAEIILVNDGSPDNSGEICEDYAGRNSCIKYFTKENEGASATRNFGMSKATGKYILFVDSDDYVTENYFQVLDRAVNEKGDADLIMFGLGIDGTEKTTVADEFAFSSEPELSDKVSDMLGKGLMYSLCTKMFKRSLIEEYGLSMLTDISISEDMNFIFRYVLNIKSIAGVTDIIYRVTVDNSASLSRGKREFVADHLYIATTSMFDALEKSGLPKDVKDKYYTRLSWMYYRCVYSFAKEIGKFDISPKEKKRKLKAVCEKYNNGNIKPVGRKCKLFAFPVRHGMSFVINLAVKVVAK